VAILDSGEGEDLVRKVQRNAQQLAAALGVPASSAIFPVVMGDEGLAMRAARQLFDDGFLVPAIRYPTVARGSARLRITVSAAHQEESIRRLRRLWLV
jgi:glycine C-acetyltransferase/8-amino-7-oxononanoate synthase